MACLSDITVYPIKSTRGIHLDQTQLQRRGLNLDRRMMLVDQNGQFITARKEPRMVLIQSELGESGLRIGAEGNDSIDLPYEPESPALVDVTVWSDQVVAYPGSEEASDWFSRFLEKDVRLVLLGPKSERKLDATFDVTFVDKFPLLILSTASLADLNRRLKEQGEEPVDMDHFRPNLVVDGVEPFEEDNWKTIEINGLKFQSGGPCARCNLVNVDPTSAHVSENGQPLRTLATYRNQDGKVMFGSNFIPLDAGELKVGMDIKVIEKK